MTAITRTEKGKEGRVVLVVFKKVQTVKQLSISDGENKETLPVKLNGYKCSIYERPENDRNDRTLLAEGSAFCSPYDNENGKVGRKIALGRAIKETDLNKDERFQIWQAVLNLVELPVKENTEGKKVRYAPRFPDRYAVKMKSRVTLLLAEPVIPELRIPVVVPKYKMDAVTEEYRLE